MSDESDAEKTELTLARPLSAGEVQALAPIVHKDISAELDVRVREIEDIDWGSGWKREEFVSIDTDYGAAPAGIRGVDGSPQ